jgi:hypothetical protein
MNSTIETHSGPVLHWTVADEKQPRPAALHVVLHKRNYVFPWSRFIYAEGAPDQVIISFSTHEVLINGYGLGHLLADVAAQRVPSLNEPHRADKFRPANEPEPKAAITELAVREIGGEE